MIRETKTLGGSVVSIAKKDEDNYVFVNKSKCNGRILVVIWDEKINDKRVGKSFYCDEVISR